VLFPRTLHDPDGSRSVNVVVGDNPAASISWNPRSPYLEICAVTLPARDVAYLTTAGLRYDVVVDGGFLCLILPDYRLPVGYTAPSTDLLIRLPPGFPDAAPDMWWCSPPIRVAATDSYPFASEVMEPMLGRTWQRFSRHVPPGAWQPGRHSLGTFLLLIRSDLERSVGAQR
jgi:hypothetical protein